MSEPDLLKLLEERHKAMASPMIYSMLQTNAKRMKYTTEIDLPKLWKYEIKTILKKLRLPSYKHLTSTDELIAAYKKMS